MSKYMNHLGNSDHNQIHFDIKVKSVSTNKVGQLEDSAGNIISQGFLMAEDLNGYFSSVFTREDISSLPVQMLHFRRLNRTIRGS